MGRKTLGLHLVFSLIVVLAALFASCSDSDPELSGASGYVVLDYAAETALPTARLAVFAETSSDVHRVERLEVQCAENKYQWICTEPIVFANDKKQWAGYTELCIPFNERIQTGVYNLTYVDAQENAVSRTFSISYDDSFLAVPAESLREKLSSASLSFREELALYDEDGMLLYYGMKRSNWKSDRLIFASNKKSAYYRSCLVSDGDTVVYMLPPVYKNTEKTENE